MKVLRKNIYAIFLVVELVALLMAIASPGNFDEDALKFIGPLAILFLATQVVHQSQRHDQLSPYWFVWYAVMMFLLLLFVIYGWTESPTVYSSATWVSRLGLAMILLAALWRVEEKLRHHPKNLE